MDIPGDMFPSQEDTHVPILVIFPSSLMKSRITTIPPKLEVGSILDWIHFVCGKIFSSYSDLLYLLDHMDW